MTLTFAHVGSIVPVPSDVIEGVVILVTVCAYNCALNRIEIMQ